MQPVENLSLPLSEDAKVIIGIVFFIFFIVLIINFFAKKECFWCGRKFIKNSKTRVDIDGRCYCSPKCSIEHSNQVSYYQYHKKEKG